MEKRLEGKVAIVTGAGRVGVPGRKRGFGAEICKHLAKQGADIVVNDFTGPLKAAPQYDLATASEMEAVAEEMRALGSRAIVVNADVSNSKAVQDMVNRTVNEFGRIDILVNNAGIAVGASFAHEFDEALWQLSLDVMATGSFLCSKYVTQQMIKQGQGGKIINIASILGKTGSPFAAGYSAAKHALVGLTRCMAAELILFKINVNAICPGYFDTHLLDLEGGLWDMFPKLAGISLDEVRKRVNDLTPAGRLGVVEEVAGAVKLLCLSPESDYINGQAIVVDGGGITI